MNRYVEKYQNLPVQMKASMWFLICSFMQKGISTITTPIFTRILTTGEYGQFSVFCSWQGIITPIICLNLYSGVYSQGLVKFDAERKEFVSSLQGLVLTLILIWLGVYLFFCDFWNNLFSLSTSEMCGMFVIIWNGAVFTFWSMNQRVDFKYKKLVLFSMLASIMQPLISIILILNSENKVLARIWGIAIVGLALYTWMFVSQMWAGKKFFSKKFWPYALKFNIPLLPHYLSLTILSSSDRIMIEKMVGESETGIYNLAYSVSMIMTMFNTALMQTIEPWIYRKLKDGKATEIARVAYPCFLIIAVLNLLLIMFAPEVITLFAPLEYQDAIWVVPSVALSVFFTFLYTFFATFEFYYEKRKYITGATLGGALLNIVLNYVCIQKFGYMAAGYTTLISYILFAILHYCFMRKICKESLDNIKPYNWKIIVGIAVGSLVIGFGIMLTYHNIFVRYGVIVLFAIAMALMRKRIINFIKNLISIKQQKS